MDDSVKFCDEALIRYLNALDPLFERAREANELEFLMNLFHGRGLEDPGWHPYVTTLRALRTVAGAHRAIGPGEAQQTFRETK